MLKHRWQQLAGLSRPERWVLAQAAVVLPLIVVSLRLFGFRRLYGWMDRRLPLAHSGEVMVGIAERTAYLVDIAARHGLLTATCLPRSLLLWYWLRRRGLPAALRIGVRRTPEGLAGHAWVEYAGMVLGEPAAAVADFRPFEEVGHVWPR